MLRIAFKTFGCRANSLDTDVLVHEARRRGLVIVDEGELADAYVINSCTVTRQADRDARLFAIRYKRRNPQAKVAVIGCYAQVAKEELLELPEIDFVVGTAEKTRVLDHLESSDEQRPGRDQVATPSGFLPHQFPGSRHARASIKIQDGCNFRCSYCIIPKARGRSRSLRLEQVLHQVEQASSQGFQEIVLTGIHLAHYGWDVKTDLMQLLTAIFSKPGPRVRVSTLDPFEIPDEMISLLRSEPRFCPYFHIALQSGSDRILSAMRRIYKAHEFDDITFKLREAVPDIFIGVDMIVGFPGETDAEFQQTLDRLQNTEWTKLHVFPFSLRPGTRAEQLDGHLPKDVLIERSAILRSLSDDRLHAFYRSQRGTERDALIETEHRSLTGYWRAHTENYLPVLVPADKNLERTIVRCTVGELEGQWIKSSLSQPLPTS